MGITEAVLLIIFLVVILVFFNIYISNSKKIRRQKIDKQLNEIDNQTKTEKENLQLNSNNSELEDNQYLQDIFYANHEDADSEVTLEEVSEEEVAGTLKSIGMMKSSFENFKTNLGDEEADLASVMFDTPITGDLNKIDEIGSEDLYNTSQLVDAQDEDFTDALVTEFKQLSPAMKTFIIANILKPKNEDE